MLLRNLTDCEEFTAGDGSVLRELFHPDKADVQIRYSLAHAKVAEGQRTRPHKLASCEVYYIMAGRGVMNIDSDSFEVGPECAVCIPPNSVQFIENMGACDLVFLCIVDPAWRQEDEQVFDR